MTKWQDYERMSRTFAPTFNALFGDLAPGDDIDQFRAEVGDDPDELTFAFINMQTMAVHMAVALAKANALLADSEYRNRVENGHEVDNDDPEVFEQYVRVADIWRSHADDLVVQDAIQGIEE